MNLRTVKTLSPREYHARRNATRRAEREALRRRTLRRARESILGHNRIREDLEILQGLWDELLSVDLAAVATDRREVVFVGFVLQNLYNVAENVLRNVADAFGNHVDGQSGWHAELLDRMRLDLTPLRPAVIDDETLEQLDELRRFRHVFRAAYTVELDAERMALVLKKALALRKRFPEQLGSFLSFLGDLDA